MIALKKTKIENNKGGNEHDGKNYITVRTGFE